ncbi:hypothetical protein POG20_18870, partial [Blautia wexlerae]|nr:hypothetical protein [Blautia wexlerae]
LEKRRLFHGICMAKERYPWMAGKTEMGKSNQNSQPVSAQKVPNLAQAANFRLHRGEAPDIIKNREIRRLI